MNCHGNVIKNMFQQNKNIDNIEVNFISNFVNLKKKKILNNHLILLKECDIFIYQPLNKNYNSDYDIKNIVKYLKSNCKKIKVNYYRFRGFMYKCNYIPYKNYGEFTFHKDFGIYESLKLFKNKNNRDKLFKFMDNININKTDFFNFFNEEINKIKFLDNNSDVKMHNFFIENYKKKYLFHDPFHPTNIFFYEIFRQLVNKIFFKNLPMVDINFLNNKTLINNSLTHWTIPILPKIKELLEATYEDNYECFHKDIHPKKINLTSYDYYYIRLLPNNFKNILDIYQKKI